VTQIRKTSDGVRRMLKYHKRDGEREGNPKKSKLEEKVNKTTKGQLGECPT